LGRERARQRKYFYICIVSLILFLNFTGCAYIDEIKREREVQRLLVDCKAHALSGKYRRALSECERILSLFPQGYPADEALYTMAVIYADPENPERNLDKAMDMLRRIEREFGESRYTYDAYVWNSVLKKIDDLSRKGDVYIGRIKIFFKKGDYISAIKENKKIINNPSHPRRAHALYNMGLIYVDFRNPQRDFDKAIMYFERVMKEYPESIFAIRARIWKDVLVSIEKSKQIDIEIEKKKKELTR